MTKKLNRKLVTEPTKGELEILQVLWTHGPSTVRFVYDQLNAGKEVIYTAILKQMQVMTEKGLLKRDETAMKHVYSAVEKEEKVKEHFLQKFIDSFYNGSPGKLVMQLLGNKNTSQEDIESVRQLLKKLDKK